MINTIKSGNPISRALFYQAYSSKLAALKAGDLSGGKFGPMWDRLVFSKVQAKLGGNSILSIEPGKLLFISESHLWQSGSHLRRHRSC